MDGLTIKQRDRDWLVDVAGYACCVCGERSGVQAHHVRGVGEGSMARKPPDWLTVPLCVQCHEAAHRARLTGDEWAQVYRTALRFVVRYLGRAKSVGAVLGEEGF